MLGAEHCDASANEAACFSHRASPFPICSVSSVYPFVTTQSDGLLRIACLSLGHPQLEAMNLLLVSPACANDLGGWLADFCNQIATTGYRVDFTAYHWYAKPSAGSLMSLLNSAYTTWGRAVSAKKQVGAGKMEKVQGVALADLAVVHQPSNLFRGRSQLLATHNQVHRLGSGKMVADRADPAETLDNDGYLPVRPAKDEPLKTTKLDDVQTRLRDLVALVHPPNEPTAPVVVSAPSPHTPFPSLVTSNLSQFVRGRWMNRCRRRLLNRWSCWRNSGGACNKNRRRVCGSGYPGRPVRYWKVASERA